MHDIMKADICNNLNYSDRTLYPTKVFTIVSKSGFDFYRSLNQRVSEGNLRDLPNLKPH